VLRWLSRRVCLPAIRWNAPFGCRQIVHVDSRKSRLIIPQRSVKQSAEHALRPTVFHRIDRLVVHALQRRIVATLHSLFASLDNLYSLDTRAEKLRVYILRQSAKVQAILEVARGGVSRAETHMALPRLRADIPRRKALP
jgi:hypothetical protein